MLHEHERHQDTERGRAIDSRAAALARRSPGLSPEEDDLLAKATNGEISEADIRAQHPKLHRLLRRHRGLAKEELDQQEESASSPWNVAASLVCAEAQVPMDAGALAEAAGKARLGAFEEGDEITRELARLHAEGMTGRLLAVLAQDYPQDAAALGLARALATRKCSNGQPAESAAKLVTAAVAVKRNHVSRSTLRRAIGDGRLTDHRKHDSPKNAPLMLDPTELDRLWPPRL